MSDSTQVLILSEALSPGRSAPTADGAPLSVGEGALLLRLSWHVRLAAVVAVLSVALAANVAAYWLQRSALLDEARIAAAPVAERMGPAVAQVQALLPHDLALQGVSTPHQVRLLSPSGATMAQTNQPGVLVPRAHVQLPVVHQGREIGQLRVDLDLGALHDKTISLGLWTLVGVLLAFALAQVLSGRMRRDVAALAKRLDDLAYRDPVTGLYNRHAAMEHLQSLMGAHSAPQGLSVVTFDLDDFKLINDTLGHAVGDETLRLVAGRLGRVLRPGARAYRFGGDEFVVICPCERGYADPERYGQMVQQALSGLTRLDGHELSLTGSVGVARYPADGETPADVVRASDIAMYEAKSRGKGHVVVFAPALRLATEHRMQLQSELRRALRSREMQLVYQPIVDARTGRVLAAEALLRWRHPERGLLLPSDFIDVAERSGLIVELGGWVLAEAALQLAQWQQNGLTDLHVAVNVSARQLHGGHLLQQYDHAVALAGCNPSSLELELTEHTLIEDLDDSIRLLQSLKQRGVSLAIDDFGTGLSSLAYLKRLPVSKLKIDRSFVAGLPHDSGDRAIVTAALSVAKAMGLTVVAEGVEKPSQARALRDLGCAQAQGFLYGKPMCAAELMALALAATDEPLVESRPMALMAH